MLKFEYDNRRNCHVAEYRGLTIRAEYDETAENPWATWDCEPPLLVSNRRGYTSYSENGDPESPFDGMPDHWFSRNWCAIHVAIGGQSESDFDAECRQEAEDYGDSLTTVRREKLEESLREARPSHAGCSDYLETLATLWQLRGVEAYTSTVRGYVQGQWADVLVVAHPEWVKKTGAPKDSHMRQMEAAANLYRAWAFGDVYGYVIESPADDNADSCWGFYGSDFKESGLADEAKRSADYIADKLRKELTETIKAARYEAMTLMQERRALCRQLGGGFRAASKVLESAIREKLEQVRRDRRTIATITAE